MHISKADEDGRPAKARLDELRQEMGVLQRKAFEKGIGTVIVLEGIDVWGIAKHTNQFARGLDPRGFDLHFTQKPTPHEKQRPFISRFFEMMPARGRIAIFDRSWYFWLVHECYRGGERRLERCITSIQMMERQHALEGWVILKFYFDLKKKELKRRSQERSPKDPCREEYHREGEEFVKDYDEVVDLWKDVLRETEAPYAPWNWIWKEDESEAMLEVITRTMQEMEAAISGRAPRTMGCARSAAARPRGGFPPGEVAMRRTVPVDKYKEALPQLQARLVQLQCQMFKARTPTVLAFEGWDAAGKGGNIVRITAPLNPRGYKVVPIGAPNADEKAHHHLWRFYRKMPRDGHIAIFDRSWYGRVLVERVEGLTPEREWRLAFDEIREMEGMLASHGTNVLKFWLHIDRDEQLRRFQQREGDEHKRWKITAEDYRNRERWDDYMPAVREMISRTDSEEAPWVVVPSNDKRYARLFVLRKVIESMERSLEMERTPWPECVSHLMVEGGEPRGQGLAQG
jgi:polyphosphate:AMP phosphotransferase